MIYKKKFFSLLLFSMIFITLLNFNVFAASGSLSYIDDDNVFHIFVSREQEENLWCWATCAEMS